MKNSILFVALILVLPLLILGCDDNNNSINATALTENDFAKDGALRADPEKGVIVTFLESPMSEETENDTGEVGIDEIPYYFPVTGSYTICWEDDDFAAEHFMELKDSEGAVVLTLEANGDCLAEVIEAGEYTMFVHNDGRLEDTLPVFLIPDADPEQQASNAGGIYNGFISGAASLLSALNIHLHEEARAQPPEVLLNIDILMSTRRCDFCNLKGVGFGGVDLRGVSIQKADLREADLRSAKLNDATLSSSNLSKADMRKADLTNVSASNAILSDVNLDEAILTGAYLYLSNLEFASLRDADMQNVNLEEVLMQRADLTGANLTSADMSKTQVEDGDFTDAVLINVNFTESFVTHANMTRANLNNANLSDANLRFANFTDANMMTTFFDNTDFGMVTWCDGCICEQGSIDTCIGCPPAGEVCTGP